MRRVRIPTLVINGDDDEPCFEPGLLMKRTIPSCGLLVLPRSGHAMNLEEPDTFNRALSDFFHTVEAGRWTQ
jgi:pimeloyl-ACP methyl ester carboxylesterase